VKNKIKLIFLTLVLPYSFYPSLNNSSLTEEEKELLQKERTTNLVLINDIFDISSLGTTPDVLAAGYQLLNALGNEQLVISTKSSFVYLKEFVKDFSIKNELTDISAFLTKKYPDDIKKSEKIIDFFKDFFDKLSQLRDQTEINNLINHYKIEELSSLSSDIKDEARSIFDNILLKFNNKGFLPEGYQAKEIDDNYVMFIPESLQNKDKSEKMQDFLLGLSYTSLIDYDDKKNEFEAIKKKSEELAKNRQELAGKILLEALAKVKIDDKSIPVELHPFFNIYLLGHGNPGQVAEIPVTPILNKDGKFEKSYFLKIMDFFNTSIRTKSLGIISCFVGGQQIKNAYGWYNKFENINLSNISFPILNIGSSYKPTYAYQKYQEYFDLLTQSPPDYNKVAELVRYQTIDNYMSIRLPNTTWFTPLELRNKSVSISQISATTGKDILEIVDKEVIILGANYIPKKIKIIISEKNNKLPVFLPSNYHNQKYFFNSLEISDYKENSLFDLLREMLFKNFSVSETVVVSFKSLKIGKIEYKNVSCIIHGQHFDQFRRPFFRTSFSYTDSSGQKKESSWLSNISPESINDSRIANFSYKDESSDNIFSNIQKFHENTLPSGLKKDFTDNLEQQLKLKQEKYEKEKELNSQKLSVKELKLLGKKSKPYVQDKSNIEKINSLNHLNSVRDSVNKDLAEHQNSSDTQSKKIVTHLERTKELLNERELALRNKFRAKRPVSQDKENLPRDIAV
jgi:hypothetical protein